MNLPRPALAALGLPAFFACSVIHAQSLWIGPDNANWNESVNWSGTAPASDSSAALVFNSASNRTSINGLTNFTASSLSITGGADNHLAGNPITLDGAFTVQTGSWQRTTLDVTLTAGPKVFDIQNGFLFFGYDFSWASPSGTISGPGGLTKTGGGWLSFAKPNTYTGGTIVDGGTLQLDTGGGAGALIGTVTVNSGGQVYSKVGDSFGYNPGSKVDTLNINGGVVTHDSGSNLTLSSAIVNLTGGTLQSTGAGAIDFYDAQALGNGYPDANTAVNTSASENTAVIAGTIHLRQGDDDTGGTLFTVADGAASTDLLVSASLSNGPYQGANSAVSKAGPGTMVLSGANSYTGATTVSAGTLTITSAFLADAADVNLSTGALLRLDFTGADTIASLKINGVAQTVGTWGGPDSSATFKSPLLSGTGTLNVTSGPAAPSPYASWASGYSLGAASYADDPDSDGLSNALEWVLGGNPTLATSSPAPVLSPNASDYVLTFTRDVTTLASVTLAAEWSTDLGTWTPVPIGATSSGPDSHGVTITVTPVSGAPDSIQVRVPASNAVAGRIFVRLKATL